MMLRKLRELNVTQVTAVWGPAWNKKWNQMFGPRLRLPLDF